MSLKSLPPFHFILKICVRKIIVYLHIVRIYSMCLSDGPNCREVAFFRLDGKTPFFIFCDSILQSPSSWFPRGRSVRSLSTSPHHPATHWRQTTLLLGEPLRVREGDDLVGFLQMRPIRRGMDIRMQV